MIDPRADAYGEPWTGSPEGRGAGRPGPHGQDARREPRGKDPRDPRGREPRAGGPRPTGPSVRAAGPNAQTTEVLPRPKAHRPIHTFKVISVFMLALSAVAGVYAAVSHVDSSSPPNTLAVDVPAATDTTIPTADPADPADPALDPAVAQAQSKAAAAAVEAADKMKKANEAEALRTQQAASRSETRKPVTPTYKVPASCAEFTGNRGIGCAILLESGFGLDQMPCLDKLFTKESHWTTTAKNKSSGAYGIPQALPGNKMASVGADWQTNPITQIKWGISYIKNRYTTPCKAWAHSEALGFY